MDVEKRSDEKKKTYTESLSPYKLSIYKGIGKEYSRKPFALASILPLPKHKHKQKS